MEASFVRNFFKNDFSSLDRNMGKTQLQLLKMPQGVILKNLALFWNSTSEEIDFQAKNHEKRPKIVSLLDR